MLWDIVRFNKEAIRDLEKNHIPEAYSLGEYLFERGYSQSFIYQYLVPMGCAIWSSSTQAMLEFPLLFFVRFFKNHGLLSVKNRPQWRVIQGGSRSYLKPLCEPFKRSIQTNRPVQSVRRDGRGVRISIAGRADEHFDQVIFACHSNQVLSMLASPTPSEVELLEAIPYQSNDVVLHTDSDLLPKTKRAWSSWNYRIDKHDNDRAILTYNMNILQGIQAAETFCVTLNATDRIQQDKILGRYQYEHPVFSIASETAVKRWGDINGANRSWFCGAYWANGFHEDGVRSALKVCQGLGVEW